jgi:hypothetical protein
VDELGAAACGEDGGGAPVAAWVGGAAYEPAGFEAIDELGDAAARDCEERAPRTSEAATQPLGPFTRAPQPQVGNVGRTPVASALYTGLVAWFGGKT